MALQKPTGDMKPLIDSKWTATLPCSSATMPKMVVSCPRASIGRKRVRIPDDAAPSALELTGSRTAAQVHSILLNERIVRKWMLCYTRASDSGHKHRLAHTYMNTNAQVLDVV